MSGNAESPYAFLLDTYETEILKIVGIWAAFPDSAMDFRPGPKSRSVIEQMERRGLELVWERRAVSRSFTGKKIVFTGTLRGLDRDEAKRLVEERGGRVTSAVSKNTSFVVVGEDPGGKAAKAKELGVKTMSEEEFSRLLASSE